VAVNNATGNLAQLCVFQTAARVELPSDQAMSKAELGPLEWTI
jgi:hypothetical protein